jgi:predicted alpha-1,2-mannosidase
MAIRQILLASAVICGLQLGSPARGQVDEVDPTIGGVGVLLEPTRPAVYLPNAMVRVYPVRKDQLDDQIHSFPLTIISHRLGELFWLMPHDGTPDAGAWGRPAAYDQEKTTPYYYSTRFDDSLIQTEFTPTERCGYFRFTFPSGKATVLLANREPGDLHTQGDSVVTGVEHFHDMQAFFYGQFNAPVTCAASGSADHKRVAATAKDGTKQLEFRYGISFISSEQAQKNLRNEIADATFDQIKDRAKDRWNQSLGRLKVEGGTPEQRRVFYTALYRCSERMINITEGGHYYSAFDHRVHEDQRPFYVDCWIWDMFRALEPLQTLLDPKAEGDKIQSYVRMYQQTGHMPTFAVLWGHYACMNGNHAAGWIADAYFRGVRDFDLNEAYAGLRKNSLDSTHLPWRSGPKTKLDDFYDEHGYMPALRPGEAETESQVSPGEKRQPIAVTLENSYDDWCIAQLARVVDKPADVDTFLKRAANYRNVFRADKGFMWPRDAQGRWIEPFDPKFDGGQGGRDYFDENNGYTYDWDVLQDYDGLFAAMGGRAKAEAKLDQLFREDLGRSKYEFFAKFPDSTGLVGQFSIGNEPSFAIPFIYNRLGAPWKTQKRVRMLLDAYFTDNLFGIPGDEDGGGMSAFVVLSMMGLYSVTPGIPTYDLCSPVFDQSTISLPGGRNFKIVAHHNSKDNKYIQAIKLNGQAISRVWLRHSEIANGGTLELEMGNTPNRELGVNAKDLPPCSIAVDPRDISPSK